MGAAARLLRGIRSKHGLISSYEKFVYLEIIWLKRALRMISRTLNFIRAEVKSQ